ncbi:MAG TPA: hypothetical protein VGE77_01525 [Nocardioides sp.]
MSVSSVIRPRRRLIGLAPAAAAVAVLVAGGVGVLLAGPEHMAEVAGVVALLTLAGAAAAVTSLALMARRRLGELQHLPDLGRKFVTHHEHGRVMRVVEGEGHLEVHLASEQVQTVALDEAGAPDHMTAGAAETSRWRMSTSRLTPPQVAALKERLTAESEITVVSSGVVALTGPVEKAWRLTSSDGLVISSGRGA